MRLYGAAPAPPIWYSAATTPSVVSRPITAMPSPLSVVVYQSAPSGPATREPRSRQPPGTTYSVNAPAVVILPILSVLELQESVNHNAESGPWVITNAPYGPR